MTDTEWQKLQQTIAQLWPKWTPTEAHKREYHYRLHKRPAATADRAVRDHFAMDDSPFQPSLSRILQRCAAVAEENGPRSTPTAEARIAQRESDRDDALALEAIRKYSPERLARAIELAVASECIRNAPRVDPEAWTKHERGFIAAADWMLNTQPTQAAKMIENHRRVK